MSQPLRSVLTFFAGITLAAVAAADTLQWGPAPQTVRKKTLEVHHYLDLAKTYRSTGDGPTIDEQLSGQLSTWERVVFVDRYDDVSAGRVGRFVRRYHEASSGGTANLAMPGPAGRMRPVKQTDTCATTMVGRDVRFTWVPKDQVYARLWERLDGPEDFLLGVDYDADVAAVLPPREVAVGDTWTVPAERAVSFLAPGGWRYFEPAKATQFSRTHKVGAGGEVAALLAAPTGKIEAKYEGKRSINGREYGVIRVELDVTSSADRREAFESVVPAEEAKDPRRLSSCVVETRYQGVGEVLWDLEARHLHHFQLKGNERVVLRLEKQVVDEADQAAALKQVSELEGTFELQLTDALPDPEPDAGGSSEKKGGE